MSVGSNPPNPSPPNIVIVGGGMVGISLALLLAKSSLQCSLTLLEQYPFPVNDQQSLWQPSFDDRATAISAGSAELFANMDCWSDLQSQAATIQAVHVSDRGYFAGVQLQAEDYQLSALGHVIPNRWLGQVLINQLQGMREAQSPLSLITSAVVTECKPRSCGYDLQVKHAEAEMTLPADLLIIADGVDSPLREQLGIAVDRYDYQQTAMVANVALAEPHRNIAYERFTHTGPIALLPLPDLARQHRAALVWTLGHSSIAEFQSLTKAQMVDHLQRSFGYRAGQIQHVGDLSFYPLSLVRAMEQVRSHLVIVGNAAHFLHPVAGQGFNLSLRDCAALVACLERVEKGMVFGSLPSLNAYLKHQALDQQLTIGLTDRLVKLFSTKQCPYALVRQLGLMGLNTVPPARQHFAKTMMGLVS